LNKDIFKKPRLTPFALYGIVALGLMSPMTSNSNMLRAPDHFCLFLAWSEENFGGAARFPPEEKAYSLFYQWKKALPPLE
jgi:hypothetical protein